MSVEPERRMVCLCGSLSYEGALAEAAEAETLAGNLVLMPHVNLRKRARFDGSGDYAQVKAEMDALHRVKIERADEVVAVCPDGYLGDSTRKEIAYAHRLGKPVRAIPEKHTPRVQMLRLAAR